MLRNKLVCEHSIRGQFTVQEHPDKAVHVVAEHEPGLAQRVQGVAAFRATFTVVAVHEKPVILRQFDRGRVWNDIRQIDDRLKDCTVIATPGRTERGIVVKPGGQYERYCEQEA
jgi:hypothetical protein